MKNEPLQFPRIDQRYQFTYSFDAESQFAAELYASLIAAKADLPVADVTVRAVQR